jgi:hypothetical protein
VTRKPATWARRIAAVLLAIGLIPAARADDVADREVPVCVPLLEPLMFWLWNRSAGEPQRIDPGQFPGVEILSHRTTDGRRLHGYRLVPRGNTAPKGFVLVAQGNATLAEQLLVPLRGYADAGYAVYVYNFRGYANSEGKRRLKAILGDYQEIFAALSQTQAGERLLYGMSFGGIVLLNVIGSGAAFDRAVIDSTPSRISGYGCPKQYNPIVNLPADSAGLLVINGANDWVVPAKDSAALLDAAEARGARVVRSPVFAHPFMDATPVHRERQGLIRSFLLQIPGE